MVTQNKGPPVTNFETRTPFIQKMHIFQRKGLSAACRWCGNPGGYIKTQRAPSMSPWSTAPQQVTWDSPHGHSQAQFFIRLQRNCMCPGQLLSKYRPSAEDVSEAVRCSSSGSPFLVYFKQLFAIKHNFGKKLQRSQITAQPHS